MLSSSLSSASTPATKENKLFGTTPFGIEIRSTPDRGRGLFTTKAFKRGDTVYSVATRPTASALSTDRLRTHCSRCFLTVREAETAKRNWLLPKLQRCAYCKIAHYCSPECAKLDLPDHKTECKAFLALRKREKERNDEYKPGSLDWLPDEGIRALGRLFWAKKRAKDAGAPCPAWDEFMLLQCQKEPGPLPLAMRDEPYRLTQYLSIVDLNVLEGDRDTPLQNLMTAYGIPGNADYEMKKLYSRFQINGHTLTSPDLSAVGVIVAPGLAMVNHSCEPNAVLVYPKGQGLGRLVAIKPIKAGEEILVSYIDAALPYSARQAELSARYNFTCNCALCRRGSDPAWIDPRWCLIHPGCKKNGTAGMPNNVRWESVPVQLASADVVSPPDAMPARPKCSACDEQFDIDDTALYTILSRGKSLLTSDARGTLQTPDIPLASSVRAVQKVCSQLLEACPPSSYPLIPLHRLLVRLMTIDSPTNLQELTKPMHHLTLALDGSRAVYGPTHPVVAVLLAQKAKLLSVDFPTPNGVAVREASGVRVEYRRKQSALTALREALVALRACFGPGGGIEGISVEMEIEATETDIQVKGMHLQMAGVRI